MDKIDKFISGNPRYNKLSKPLTAAKVCDAARSLSESRFSVISFRQGLLTLGVGSSAEAGNLQAESTQLISQINTKLDPKGAPSGQELVNRLRFKIV